MTKNRKSKATIRRVQEESGLKYTQALRAIQPSGPSARAMPLDEEAFAAQNAYDDDGGYGPDSYFARAMSRDN